MKIRLWSKVLNEFIHWECIDGSSKNRFCEQWDEITENAIPNLFAGISDRNGVDIYEGDIVKDIHTEKISEVKFPDDCVCYGLEPFNDDYFIDGNQVTVIGNIYEK